MGKWPAPSWPWRVAVGTGYLLGKCPLCWQPLPLPLRGLRTRGALRAAERGLAREWTSPLDLLGLASAGVWLCRAGAHVGTYGVFRSVCVHACVQDVCVYLGLLICRYRCVCAGWGSWTCLCLCSGCGPSEGVTGLGSNLHSSGAGAPPGCTLSRRPGQGMPKDQVPSSRISSPLWKLTLAWKQLGNQGEATA